MICGAVLDYLQLGEDLTCSYCGKGERGVIKCPNNHYVCDSCHNRESVDLITDITVNSTSTNPVEISELMMSHPGLPMLGCQHAFIAAGALLAAIRNEGLREVTPRHIEDVFERIGKQAIGGY